MSTTKAVALAIVFVFLNIASHCYGAGLQIGFYKGKCGRSDVEDIVKKAVLSKWNDRSIAPALIRMQFHDCFVNGCDASILLDGPNSEKTAPPNLSVRGYNVIDAAKAAVEKACPGVVSCADIIIMATRDVVSLSGGGRYNVQTGRRDGLVSLAQNTRSLPAPSISVSNAIKSFASKGISATDMIYLLGGHTIGVAHCSLFKDRLYNFKNNRKPDPTMDLGLLKSLRATCAQNATVDRTVNLDQNPLSSKVVDKSFYNQIIKHRGILQIDQELALDRLSKSTVAAIAGSLDFNAKFGQAMVKLGAIQVLTGTQGQIRKSCHAVNQKTPVKQSPPPPMKQSPPPPMKQSPPPPMKQPPPPPMKQSPPPPMKQSPPPPMTQPPPPPMTQSPPPPMTQSPPPPMTQSPPPPPMMQSPPPPPMTQSPPPPSPPMQPLNTTPVTNS